MCAWCASWNSDICPDGRSKNDGWNGQPSFFACLHGGIRVAGHKNVWYNYSNTRTYVRVKKEIADGFRKEEEGVSAEKNGLRALWRMPGRSALFFCLLLAMAAILSLCLCIYTAVSGYLSDCDEYFRTVAELEYIGEQYPDSRVCDEGLCAAVQSGELDVDALIGLNGVMGFDANTSALGVAEGVRRKDSGVYDPDLAVITVFQLHWDKNSQAYMGFVGEELYSYSGLAGKTVFVSPGGLAGLDSPDALDTSYKYVLAGKLIRGKNSNVWFLTQECTVIVDGERMTLSGYEALPDGVLAEDSPYRALANMCMWRNNGFRVQRTSDLQSLRPFQQEELKLTSGRAFTQAEYDAGAKVCVLSDRAAQYLNAGVGDEFALSVNELEGGIYSAPIDALAPAERYTVVGVYAATEDYFDWIFLPEADNAALQATPTGYQAGQFRLENDKADAFYQQALALLPQNFRLTVYDQGYARTAEPYQELLAIAKIFLAVCALVLLAVLALFGYLFVTRQRETAQTMLALGAGKGHVSRYFLTGAAVLALPAAAAGVWVSRLAEGRVLGTVAEFAAQYGGRDQRFSVNLLSLTRTLEFLPQTPAWVYLLSGGLLAGLTLVFCAAFARAAMRQEKPRRKKARRAKTPRRASKRPIGNYALRSAVRGGLRSVSVVLLAAMAAVFLAQLTSTADVYDRQLEALRTNMRVRGYATDNTGRKLNDLVVGADKLQKLIDTELVEDVSITDVISNYRFIAISKGADGTEYEVQMPALPAGSSFAMDTLRGQMRFEPEWIATNDVLHCPQFYYDDAPQIAWLEGYGPEQFSAGEPDICVVPDALAQEQGIALGCYIRILAVLSTSNGLQARGVDLYVVGIYDSASVERTIYSAMDYDFPLGRETVEAVPRENARVSAGYASGAITSGKMQQVLFVNAREDDEAAQPFLARISEDPDACRAYYDGKPLSLLTQTNTRVCVASREYLKKCVMNEMIVPDYEGQSVYDYVQSHNHGLWRYNVYLEFPAGDSVKTFLLIGDYEKQPGEADVYFSPLGWSWEGRQDSTLNEDTLYKLNFSGVTFTLKDNAQLDTLRQALEDCGFSSARAEGDERAWAVIDDREYLSATQSLERQAQYLNALYIFLYVLVGIVGLAAAYLLLGSRAAELAVLCALGTQRRRLFAWFMAEQLALTLLGAACGLGIWYLAGGALQPLCYTLTAAFAACWLVGTLTHLAQRVLSKSAAALAERE